MAKHFALSHILAIFAPRCAHAHTRILFIKYTKQQAECPQSNTKNTH